MYNDIKDTIIHDKIITSLGSKKEKNNDDKIFTGDIEEEKTGKLTVHINEENIHHISD